jgi:hypothetical protein
VDICLGACIIILLLVLFFGAAECPPKLEHAELLRLRRLSDKLHREDILPLE